MLLLCYMYVCMYVFRGNGFDTDVLFSGENHLFSVQSLLVVYSYRNLCVVEHIYWCHICSAHIWAVMLVRLYGYSVCYFKKTHSHWS